MENSRKLTIGMVVYDDFDGFYFTFHSLRLYHKDAMKNVEFVVINTNPSSRSGQSVKKICSSKFPEPVHYYEDDNSMGTATRTKIFNLSKTPYVLVIDPHVLIEPDGVSRLISFFDEGLDNGNLLQSPLLLEDHSIGPSKFNPQWRSGMLGTWDTDERVHSGLPFEIDGQGLGLFACRKDSWLGFVKNHSGFGSEEITVNERFKVAGKTTLCLPWLKWLHRFERPSGAPYKNDYKDRVKNYFRNYFELNKPIFEIIEHFKTIGVSEEKMRKWLDEVLVECN